VFIGLFIVPYFLLIGTGNPALITLALTLGLVLGQSTTQSTQTSLFAEQYEAPIRYSGVSVAYQFATVVWSGPTPIIAAGLFAWAGSWVPLACYIIVAAILSVACILPLREAAGAALGPVEAGKDDLAQVALRGRPA
jgi:MHS family shikimate/dehydroshikimate transporter-like MFS transporter